MFRRSGFRFADKNMRKKSNKPHGVARAARLRRSARERHLFTLRGTVKDGERALVTRDGRFERVLEPGRHTLFDPARRIAVEQYNVVRAEFPADKLAVRKAGRPDLSAELFVVIEHSPGHL